MANQKRLVKVKINTLHKLAEQLPYFSSTHLLNKLHVLRKLFFLVTVGFTASPNRNDGLISTRMPTLLKQSSCGKSDKLADC